MTMLNIYELNDRASKYMKPKLKVLQRVIDELIFMVGDFWITDRTSGQKIIKDILD